MTPGRPDDASGRAQLAYLTAATDAALAGEVTALVTAPISKEWIARAGFTFPGTPSTWRRAPACASSR